MAEDEMVGWHHQLDGHEFEQLQELVMDREACPGMNLRSRADTLGLPSACLGCSLPGHIPSLPLHQSLDRDREIASISSVQLLSHV